LLRQPPMLRRAPAGDVARLVEHLCEHPGIVHGRGRTAGGLNRQHEVRALAALARPTRGAPGSREPAPAGPGRLRAPPRPPRR